MYVGETESGFDTIQIRIIYKTLVVSEHFYPSIFHRILSSQRSCMVCGSAHTFLNIPGHFSERGQTDFREGSCQGNGFCLVVLLIV